jgi:hypothetical protein
MEEEAAELKCAEGGGIRTGAPGAFSLLLSMSSFS